MSGPEVEKPVLGTPELEGIQTKLDQNAPLEDDEVNLLHSEKDDVNEDTYKAWIEKREER